MPSKMDCLEGTIGVPVRRLEEARTWYARLLGRPPDLEPVPGIVEFEVGHTWLQLEEGAGEPRGWVFRIGVRDLTQERTRLEQLGVAIGETITIPGVIQFFDFQDPDGNRLSLYELRTPPKPGRRAARRSSSR